MSTPKEKANELVDKFRNEFKWVEKDHHVDLYRDARQCALIAVDEIKAIYEGMHKPEYASFDIYEPYNYTLEGHEGVGKNGYEMQDYWEQVKTEITNL
jgi:hypothetical protein